MGKGKKKGGQASSSQNVESATSAIQSLTVNEPSTSQNPDDVGGLGLTGGSVKSKVKKKPEQVTLSEAAAALPTIPSTSTIPIEKDVEKEEECFGLGLDTGKKRRPKKKKTATPVETVQSVPAPNIPAPVANVPAPVTNIPPAVNISTQKSQEQQQPPVPSTFPSWSQGARDGTSQGSWRQSAGRGRGQLPPLRQESQTTYGHSKPESHYHATPGTSAPVTRRNDDITEGKMIPPSAQRQVVPKTFQEITCRFEIPKKIFGNSVHAKSMFVLTNYLPMTIKPHKVYRYDVSFQPDRPKKMLPQAYNLSKDTHFKNIEMAFDQVKNCYSLVPLPRLIKNERFVTNVEFLDANGKNMKFEVSYKFTGTVDLGTIIKYMQSGGTSLSPPTEAIQCIDVVLRQGTLDSYVKAGRQFFRRPAHPVNLGDGLEMWTGLFQSGIFTSRAFVNIDVAHKGFPKQQPLIKALEDDFRLDPRKPLETQNPWYQEKFLAFLKGLRVVANIGGDNSSRGQKREFVCNGLVKSALTERFPFEDPQTKRKTSMTVGEYFSREKGVNLRYPNLNCVWVGSREKTIYYPMELLEVAYGQAQNKQLNETQLPKMVREAATPPDIRKKKIEEVIQNMNYSRNPTFKKFGLEISNEFYQVKAKVLMPPRLQVGENQYTEPRRGVWQARGVYKPEALQSWGFVAIECDGRTDFAGIIKMTTDIGTQMGMRVTAPRMTKFDAKIRDLHTILFSALEKEIKFLFVIVSSRGRDYYHRVKQLAEREVGILTQCIKEQTASQRMNQQTIRNILLKVNSKLMGINQALDSRAMPKCLMNGGVMVVGADVTHPSPDQSSIPSIAAVTASMDNKCSLYNIELSIQTPKKEMIVEFEDMMVDHLKVYRKHQNSYPKKIFVFRDGVSEGQFAQVMNSELQAVHNAYKTVVGPQAKPEVLFLLVQKRHHTRLFVPGSNQNVDPGTVVDTDIVHASELDFYLVSHQAIKGTARPTRYHAVCNDGCIPHDEVEQLTYYLCHLYSRCMRSVSYPTPTYYAHLACLRARSLTYGEKFDNQELERKPKRLRVMDKILQYSRMFFV